MDLEMNTKVNKTSIETNVIEVEELVEDECLRCKELEQRMISVMILHEEMLQEKKKLEAKVRHLIYYHDKQIHRITKLTLCIENSNVLKEGILELEKKLDKSEEDNKILRGMIRNITFTP